MSLLVHWQKVHLLQKSLKSSAVYNIFCVLCRRWKRFPGKVLLAVVHWEPSVCLPGGRPGWGWGWLSGGLGGEGVQGRVFKGSEAPKVTVGPPFSSALSWVGEVLHPAPSPLQLTPSTDFLSPPSANPDCSFWQWLPPEWSRL